MSDPLRTAEDYELFIYSLPQRFSLIQSSTLIFVRRGASLARVSGELVFRHGHRLTVRERLLFDRSPGVIDWYGYELWREHEKMSWYDPQPHPDVPELQSSHPHHQHVPPNIKHHRIPAPHLNFTRENLSTLIAEIAAFLEVNFP